MRLYSFTNYYLSSLQKGLQTAHCVSDMSLLNHNLYLEWAKSHKTVVILNGGNSGNLQSIYDFFLENHKSLSIDMPFVKFHEDEVSLGGALTSVAIVIPELYYSMAAKVRMNLLNDEDLVVMDKFNDVDKDFIKLLNSYSLAS